MAYKITKIFLFPTKLLLNLHWRNTAAEPFMQTANNVFNSKHPYE